jgi:hypothetical protein
MGLDVSEISPDRFLPQGQIFFLLPEDFLRMVSRHSCQEPPSPASFTFSYTCVIWLFIPL